MESTLFIATAVGAAALAAVILLAIALWRHKRASAGEVRLLGEHAMVETRLDPVGSVIVAGELWRARSKNDESIDAGTRVRVVGMQGHLILVELAEPPA